MPPAADHRAEARDFLDVYGPDILFINLRLDLRLGDTGPNQLKQGCEY